MPFIPFLLFIIAGTYTPGPNNIMAMNCARQSGMRRSMPFMAGMAAGLSMVVVTAAVFNIYLTRIMPAIRPYLGAAGASYMLWLAAKPFLPLGKGESASTDISRSFVTGAMLQFINPKVVFYALAITASFIIPYSDSLPFVAAVAVALGAIGFTSLLCWGGFGVIFQRYFSAYETGLNIFMALLLSYCAYSVAVIR